jgi:hypothetical protein
MSVLEYVRAQLRDPDASADAVGRAARRDPILLRLGELYGARFGRGADAGGDPALDWDINDLESKAGLAPPEGGAPGGAADGAWKGYVRERLLSVPAADGRPEAVLVTGQPGAGKGVVTELVCQYFVEEREPCVVVAPGELLYLHPAYAPDAARDDRTAAQGVRPEVAELARELLEQAAAAKKHLVLDDPPADPDAGTALIRALDGHGYHVTVLALSVPPGLSWQAVQDRYAGQREVMGVGRWVDATTHQAACTGLRAFVAAAVRQGLAEVHLLTRQGDLLAPASGEADPPAPPPGQPGPEAREELTADAPAEERGSAPEAPRRLSLSNGWRLELEGMSNPQTRRPAGTKDLQPPPPAPGPTGPYRVELITPPGGRGACVRGDDVPAGGRSPGGGEPARSREENSGPAVPTDWDGDPLSPEQRQEAVARRQALVDVILGRGNTGPNG